MLLNLIVIPPGIGSVGVTWLISFGIKIRPKFIIQYIKFFDKIKNANTTFSKLRLFLFIILILSKFMISLK